MLVDWLGSDHVETPTDTHNNRGSSVFCAPWSVWKVYKRHGKSLVAVEFQSSKGTVVWPEVIVEGELEVGL
jgi:hypothetical protein